MAGAGHIYIGDICGDDEIQLDRIRSQFRAFHPVLPETFKESQVHVTRIDVSDAASVEEWVQTIVDEAGGLDLAANIAGIAQPAYARPPARPAILHEPTAEWNHILDVNLGGIFNCARAEVRAMTAATAADDQQGVRQEDRPDACHESSETTTVNAEACLPRQGTRARRGAIVNMASLTACTPLGDIYAYGTSKAAVAHFSACLAKDVWKHGITVNAISPGM